MQSEEARDKAIAKLKAKSKALYDQTFGTSIGSKDVAHKVVTDLQTEFDNYFPDRAPPLLQNGELNLLELSRAVNNERDHEFNRVHTVGLVECGACGRDMYETCTICVGPHIIDGFARQNAIDNGGLCDTCAIKESVKRKRSAAKRKLSAMHRFKQYDPIPGSMTWAEHMGNFYKLKGKPPFKTCKKCMRATYKNDLNGMVRRYTKDHLYYMAEAMGFPFETIENMNKLELCELITNSKCNWTYI